MSLQLCCPAVYSPFPPPPPHSPSLHARHPCPSSRLQLARAHAILSKPETVLAPLPSSDKPAATWIKRSCAGLGSWSRVGGRGDAAAPSCTGDEAKARGPGCYRSSLQATSLDSHTIHPLQPLPLLSVQLPQNGSEATKATVAVVPSLTMMAGDLSLIWRRLLLFLHWLLISVWKALRTGIDT